MAINPLFSDIAAHFNKLMLLKGGNRNLKSSAYILELNATANF